MKLIALIFLLLSTQVFAQSKKKIMVSYFQPFGLEKANHTSDVAKKIKEQFGKDKNIEIILCPLSGDGMPTTFYSSRENVMTANGPAKLQGKSSFETLKDCYNENPDVEQVISLGEGFCMIQVEGISRNRMSTGFSDALKDNGGNHIPGVENILPNPENKQGISLKKTDDVNLIATCLQQNTGHAVYYSDDSGVYVCNNLMYNFQSYIDHNKLPVSFSFVHIPPHLDRSDACGDMGQFKKNTRRSFNE